MVDPSLRTASHERRLLIIEDDEQVADALAQILEPDYDVTLVVADGDVAAALLEEEGATFETVLCDMQLGHTTGKQLYERLRERRPELAERMIFMTGEAFRGPLRQFLDGCPIPCLVKPFNRSELRNAVAAMLSRPASPAGAE